MHFAAHIAATLVAFSAFVLVLPVQAQGVPGIGPAAKVGEMEVKAYQKISKDKVAVQLTSDNHLARELRRQVMVRLSQRGNQVGFSGGNVMRMDVSYFDLLGGNDRSTGTIGGWPDYVPPGSNPRPALPSNPVGRRDGLTPSTVGPTLRITLTLYSRDGGKVLWTASGSCMVQAEKSQLAGEAIINRIFDSADKSAVADSGCPL
jgi:hypothetical protein